MDRLTQTVAQVTVEPIDTTASTTSVLAAFLRRREPVVLESTLRTAPFSRYSVFAANPAVSFEIWPNEPDPWQTFRDYVSRYGVSNSIDGFGSFAGGWIGFLTYEFALLSDSAFGIHASESDLPLARFGLYDTAAVFDHEKRTWYAVLLDWPSNALPEREPSAARRSWIKRVLESAQQTRESDLVADYSSSPAEPTMSRDDYLRCIQRIKEHIARGDVYQVNLTQRFTTETKADSGDVYRKLRQSSPSAHGAFLQFGETSIISSSPELFLHVNDRNVTTRPIKGTRPRVGDPVLDTEARLGLDGSSKERAELNMIVDLLRNDLGRVSEFGSVRVISEGTIEEHPTLFHRVATIASRLRPDYDCIDLLKATLPGGSITGAPKIRATQIIDSLERTPRGVYCGCIGWIGLDGSMQMNLAIRTMIQRGCRVHLNAGGGIVTDSIPEYEYDEMIAKLTGMLRALRTDVVSSDDHSSVEAALV